MKSELFACCTRGKIETSICSRYLQPVPRQTVAATNPCHVARSAARPNSRDVRLVASLSIAGGLPMRIIDDEEFGRTSGKTRTRGPCRPVAAVPSARERRRRPDGGSKTNPRKVYASRRFERHAPYFPRDVLNLVSPSRGFVVLASPDIKAPNPPKRFRPDASRSGDRLRRRVLFRCCRTDSKTVS